MRELGGPTLMATVRGTIAPPALPYIYDTQGLTPDEYSEVVLWAERRREARYTVRDDGPSLMRSSTVEPRQCDSCGLVGPGVTASLAPVIGSSYPQYRKVDRCADHVGCDLRREKAGV